jgi:hypothetical protein
MGEAVVVPATCLVAGTSTVSCTRAGCAHFVVTPIAIDPNAHAFVGGICACGAVNEAQLASAIRAALPANAAVTVNVSMTAGVLNVSIVFDGKVESMFTGTVATFNFDIVVAAIEKALADGPVLPDPPGRLVANQLQALGANIIRNGLNANQLLLSANNNAVLTLRLAGMADIILARGVNNRNVAGTVALGDGYFLRFDIKGNGSNIKDWTIIRP